MQSEKANMNMDEDIKLLSEKTYTKMNVMWKEKM